MPLSAEPVSRIRKHSRSVRFEGYARADGLQLDRCHALATDGEAMRLYYPRWQRVAKTGTD